MSKTRNLNPSNEPPKEIVLQYKNQLLSKTLESYNQVAEAINGAFKAGTFTLDGAEVVVASLKQLKAYLELQAGELKKETESQQTEPPSPDKP